MDALYLADENGYNRLVLRGAGAESVINSLQRQTQPRRLPDGRVEEIITLECRSGNALDLITRLEQRLALNRDGVRPLFLWFETSTRLAPLAGRILDGRIESLGGGTADRQRGYFGLRLNLWREDWLSESIRPLPLSNTNVLSTLLGIPLYNHHESGTAHVNHCDINAADIGGSQPVPARLVLEVGDAGVRRLGRIVVSGGAGLWDENGSYNHVLEGETASIEPGCTASSSQNSSAASGGIYRNFQWTAATETAVCSWVLSGEQLAWLRGRGLRPVARLQNLPPAGVRWRWKLVQLDGGGLLDQSAQVQLQAGSQLQLLPSFFPPRLSNLAPYQDVQLEVWLECGVIGTKQLDLDFVHLLPLENLALFQPISGITQNHNLVMNWGQNELFAENAATGEKSLTHTVSGAPLMLQPGLNHRIYVLYESDFGFQINDSIKVRMQAGSRWIEP